MTDVYFNFATLLTLLTLVTGVVWALDKFWLEKRRNGAEANAAVDFGRSFFPVIALVLILRSFLAEPFRIPSGSMLPTLHIGDFILVNKYTYGLRDPVFHYKLLKLGEPQRGEIVVFRYPVNPSQDFIKRIVGVPGDHIAYREKTLYVNGQKATQQPADVYSSPYGNSYRYVEDLVGVSHSILVRPGEPTRDFEFTVPEGEYFAMGDNRDASLDSRYWGTVPEKNLVGRAFFIWMNQEGGAWPWQWDVNFSRIGTKLQ